MRERDIPKASHGDEMFDAWCDYVDYCQSLGYTPVEPDFAFSFRAKKEIRQRSGGQCETHDGECGFEQLEASHLSHKRGRNYNNPDNGVYECRPAHFDRHLNQLDPNLPEHQHEWAAQQIWLRMTPEERQWYIENG